MTFVVERRLEEGKWKAHGWVKNSPGIHAALRVVQKRIPMWAKRIDNFRLRAEE